MSKLNAGKIEDELLRRGLISQDQISIALTEQRKIGGEIEKIFTKLGFIGESVIREIVSEATGSKLIDLDKVVPDEGAINLVDKKIATRYTIVPVSYDVENATLVIAMEDPLDLITMEKLRSALSYGVKIEGMSSSVGSIRNAIDQFYGYELSLSGIIRELETGEVDFSLQDTSDGEYNHPLVRLVNSILADAVKKNASDIHFEPELSFLRLRYRIDGVLQQVLSIHKDHYSAIAVRLKVVSGMDIAETRAPQDGRITLEVANRTIDFRVASQPTTHGENIVLRVLDRSKGIVPLSQLNLDSAVLQKLKTLMSRPEGIIIVTGPTGSGKTTTLYSMINYQNKIGVNIMTLEDPVEYPMEMIRQTSVGEASKMDFASGIRSLMRQDPDIILVGEMRDGPTAEMAFRAAMTGHQVFTTLHTNSAAAAFSRLLDIGVKPSVMAGSILGIVGQRLVRKLCLACAKSRPAAKFELFLLGSNEQVRIKEAVGCKHCNSTGYRGRLSILEVLMVDQEIDRMIINGAAYSEIMAYAVKNGFKTMSQDGIRRILLGQTTIEELSRVVDLTKSVGE